MAKNHRLSSTLLNDWHPHVPFYLATLVLTIIVVAIDQITHPLHPDVAFHITVASSMIENGGLNGEFFDANPPLFAIMMTIPVLLNSFLGISIVFWCKSLVVAVSLLSFLCIKKELAKWSSITLPQSTALSCLLILPVLLGTDFSFGQRDHYCAIFMIPYTIYVAVRWASPSEEKLKLTLMTYVLLALCIAIKPYYILIWIMGEGFLAIKTRHFKSFLSSGNILVIIIGIFYLTLLAIFKSSYYTEILPVATATFGEMGNEYLPEVYIFFYSICAIALATILFLNIDKEIKRFVVVFSTLSLAAVSAFFMQSGYSYQIIPAAVLLSYSYGLIMFFIGIRICISFQIKRRLLIIRVGKALVAVLLLSQLIMDINTIRKSNASDVTSVWMPKYQTFKPQTILLQTFKPSTSVGALSVNIYLPFPAVLYSNLKWKFTFPHLWPLPKMVMDDQYGNERFEWFAQKIATNLVKEAPDIMLVDQRNPTTYIRTDDGSNVTFDYIKYLSRNDNFTKVWGEYREIGVLSHSKGRCIKIFAHKNFTISNEISAKLHNIIANHEFSCPVYDYP